METIFLYLIKVQVVLSVLILAYLVLLRKERFFQLNRIFLLFSIFLAFALPFFPSSAFSEWTSPVLSQIPESLSLPPLQEYEMSPVIPDEQVEMAEPEVVSENTTPTTKWSIWTILMWTYCGIALILGIRLVLNLSTLASIIFRVPQKREHGFVYLFHREESVPFSFFHFIVANPENYQPEEFRQILAHEEVHSRQWHSLDILLAELLTIIFWINPLVWILRHSIKLNLEYLADYTVLSGGVNRKAYQYSILQTCLRPANFQVANLFNGSPIKSRIKMMNAKQSPKIRLLKYFLVVPVLALAYAFIQPLPAASLPAISEFEHPEKGKENIYVVIKPGLESDWLSDIERMLEPYNVLFKVNNKNFDNDELMAIDLTIEVPGLFKKRLSGERVNGFFEPLVFYYEKGYGSKIDFVKGIPTALSETGKEFISGNLVGAIIYESGGPFKMTGAVSIPNEDESSHGSQNIYVKINPDFREELMVEIAKELKSNGVDFKVRQKNYDNGKLTSIRLEIDIPGTFNAELQATEEANEFETLYFYYETLDGKKNVGVSRGFPENISAKGKKILTQNLIMGMYLLRADGTGHTIGAINLD